MKFDIIFFSPPFAEQNSRFAGGGDRPVRPDKKGNLYRIKDVKQSGITLYSDDRNNIGNLRYGKRYNDIGQFRLALCSYNRKNINQLSKKLKNKYNISISINGNRYLYLCIHRKSTKIFNDIIKSYIIPSMQYKLIPKKYKRYPYIQKKAKKHSHLRYIKNKELYHKRYIENRCSESKK